MYAERMNPLTLASLLSTDADNTVAENVIYLTTGFVIVIGALAILWGFCALIGQYFIRQAEAAAAALAEKKAAAPAPPPADPPGSFFSHNFGVMKQQSSYFVTFSQSVL